MVKKKIKRLRAKAKTKKEGRTKVKGKKKSKKPKKLTSKKVKKSVNRKKTVKKIKGPRVIAKIEHYFGKISVAAFKLKAPLKVGDIILIKGHKTDFIQRIDSIQIEHESVLKAEKGDEVGIKVKHKVREQDVVYLAEAKDLQPKPQTQKSILIQKPMFPMANFQKNTVVEAPKPVARPVAQPIARPVPPLPSASPSPQPAPLPSSVPKKSDPYGGTRFLSF